MLARSTLLPLIVGVTSESRRSPGDKGSTFTVKDSPAKYTFTTEKGIAWL
jgi:hypothetical protein